MIKKSACKNNSVDAISVRASDPTTFSVRKAYHTQRHISTNGQHDEGERGKTKKA